MLDITAQVEQCLLILKLRNREASVNQATIAQLVHLLRLSVQSELMKPELDLMSARTAQKDITVKVRVLRILLSARQVTAQQRVLHLHFVLTVPTVTRLLCAWHLSKTASSVLRASTALRVSSRASALQVTSVTSEPPLLQTLERSVPRVTTALQALNYQSDVQTDSTILSKVPSQVVNVDHASEESTVSRTMESRVFVLKVTTVQRSKLNLLLVDQELTSQRKVCMTLTSASHALKDISATHTALQTTLSGHVHKVIIVRKNSLDALPSSALPALTSHTRQRLPSMTASSALRATIAEKVQTTLSLVRLVTFALRDPRDLTLASQVRTAQLCLLSQQLAQQASTAQFIAQTSTPSV